MHEVLSWFCAVLEGKSAWNDIRDNAYSEGDLPTDLASIYIGN